MSLGTPAALLLAVLFLIPGFLWRKVMDACSPYAPRGKVEFIESLTLSCFNYLAGIPFLVALILLWPKGLDLRQPGCLASSRWFLGYLCLWFIPVFIVPVILGLVFGRIRNVADKQNWLRGILHRLGVRLLHPAPTAWDYVFARGEPYWARVRTANGELIEGIFDSDSLASGKEDYTDLFLQHVFYLNEEEGTYETVEQNRGVWIAKETIASIEFFALESGEDVVGGSDHVE